jgi:hypothetical protein
MSNDAKLIAEIESLKRRTERLEVKEQPKAGMYNMDTYFDDLQYQLVGQKMESPSSHITYSTNRDYVILAKTCDWNDDWLTMVIQMSHRWKTGTVVYPHLHWIQSEQTVPNLAIGYMWEVNGATTNTTWLNLAHTSNVFTWVSGSLNQITKFGSITPPVGAGLSDLLHIKLYRDVANESTLFSAPEVDAKTQDNVYADSFDIHFEIDSAGSDSEYVK